MDAVEFVKERQRMCKSYGEGCLGCPMDGGPCGGYRDVDAERLVGAVEAWSTEHPRKTRQSELLKIFPDAVIDTNTGAVLICPATISNSYRDEEGICKQVGVYCCDCQSRFWLEEIE